MKKSIIIPIILLILIGSSSVFGFKKMNKAKTPTDAITITMTEAGFSPAKLSIKKGTTVIFINKGKELHWPASNIHPSHGIYPEFDPRKPIEVRASWSFKFGKVGSWRFHDHLAPTTKGVITVK